MNLPNKLTISRIFLAIIIVILLIFPFKSAGITFPNLFVNEMVVVNIKYLIIAIIFVIASITDYLDGKLARKFHQETDFGKIMDFVADKLLVDSILIILSSQSFIHPIIPILIISIDVITDAIRMMANNKGKKLQNNKLSKIKSYLLTIGIFLTLIYNLPFELINLKVSDIILIIGTVMAVISCVQYYNENKKIVVQK